MIVPINVQIYYFLSTVIAGIAVGIMFDAYRIITGVSNINRIVLAISDLLFWVLCAMTIFVFFLYSNNGDLRLYTFIGLLLGILFYFKLASKRFIIALRGIIYFISKLFRIVFILIIYPLKRLVYLLRYLLYLLKRLVNKVKRKAAKENF
jgi:spore cortex biosynthesis protein YabQ